MHMCARRLAIGVAAALATALGASSATAIEISPAGAMTATSLGLVTFRSSVADVECRVTLEGTLASRVRDESGQHVATTESVSVGECRGGNAIALTEPDWTVTLAEEAAGNLSGSGAETTGTFGLLIEDVQFLVQIVGVSCLYTGSVTTDLTVSGLPLLSGLIAITASSIRRSGGPIFCPTTGSLTGQLALAPTQTLAL